MGKPGLLGNIVITIRHLLYLPDERRLADSALTINGNHAFLGIEGVHAVLDEVGSTNEPLRVTDDARSKTSLWINKLEHGRPACQIGVQ
jgi:hypothetical protein